MVATKFRLSALLLTTATLPLPAQVPAPTPLSAADSTKLMARGHAVMTWIFANKPDSVLTALAPEFVAGNEASLADKVASVAQQLPNRTGIITEQMTRRNGNPQFWYEAVFTNQEEPIVFRLVFDANGKISGIGMGPKSSAKWDH